MANSRDIFNGKRNNVSQLLEQLNAAVRDSQHEAVFAFEGHGRMGRTGVVQDVLTGAALPLLVTIAALQDENFFETNMPMRGIMAAGLHANQYGRIVTLFVAPQHVHENPWVTSGAPIDRVEIVHENLSQKSVAGLMRVGGLRSR